MHQQSVIHIIFLIEIILPFALRRLLVIFPRPFKLCAPLVATVVWMGVAGYCGGRRVGFTDNYKGGKR